MDGCTTAVTFVDNYDSSAPSVGVFRTTAAREDLNSRDLVVEASNHKQYLFTQLGGGVNHYNGIHFPEKKDIGRKK